jgi:glycosyltransferase involved in cell wall biosynthesis
MKILFLSDNFPPEVNAPANRTFEHCREWVHQGVEVTVITCTPNFPQGHVFEGYKNKLWQRADYHGIRVIRVWSYIAPNRGMLRRALDYLSFCISSFIAGLFCRCDLIVATSPQFFTALAGNLLALVKRRPWVFEVRDLWPESIRAVDAVRGRGALHFLEWLELSLYRRAASIVVVTESFRKDLISRQIAPQKISVVRNGVDCARFAPRRRDVELAEQLGVHDAFVVAYIGTHGLAHRLSFILNCAEALRNDRSVRFLFIGDGAEKEALLQQKAVRRLENCIFHASVPHDSIVRYVSLADVSLVTLRRSQTFCGVIPSKIFESAAMERPILLGVDGEARELIEEYRAGLYFEPESQKDFLAKLQMLQKDAALYLRCQEGCRRLAAAFSREHLAREMLSVLKEVLGSSGSMPHTGVGSVPAKSAK